jgi:hypothetical protein
MSFPSPFFDLSLLSFVDLKEKSDMCSFSGYTSYLRQWSRGTPACDPSHVGYLVPWFLILDLTAPKVRRFVSKLLLQKQYPSTVLSGFFKYSRLRCKIHGLNGTGVNAIIDWRGSVISATLVLLMLLINGET